MYKVSNFGYLFYLIFIVKQIIMKINIEGKNYQLKNTIRSLFIFEKIAGKQFDGKNLIDYYILFYSNLLANNPDEFNLTFDEFIELNDQDMSLFNQFVEFITKSNQINNQLIDKDKEEENDIKKKK